MLLPIAFPWNSQRKVVDHDNALPASVQSLGVESLEIATRTGDYERIPTEEAR